MTRADLSEKDLNKLTQKIYEIVMEKGLKSTTMDMVATKLGMSKRTLYEIFGSKSEMLKETFLHLEDRNRKLVKEKFATSSNVMEALIELYKSNRDWFQKINPAFFRDMDRLYKCERERYDHTRRVRNEEMMSLFNLGMEQGMFRRDVDYRVQSRIMGIQMESLKRMEKIFPEDITPLRVYDAIILGFLRSIASAKGMKLLDKLSAELIHN